MKTKIVLWGTDASNEKVLIGLELRPDANKVDVLVFPITIVTDEFTTKMMDEWRNGNEVVFPEGYKHIERELAVADSILPEDLKVERGDIIQRAQNEWHFIVLSTKLNQAYRSELDDYKDKVEKMPAYDSIIWDNLKGFWDKVQEQVRDRNLFREHADLLRDGINDLFGKLKDMRTALNSEFEQKSSDAHGRFMTTLNSIDERIKTNAKASSIFDDLKTLQANFKNAVMTRDHRNQVWERIDISFKAAKTGKFGESNPNVNQEFASASARIQSRLDGLNAAINKMEITLRREREDLNFQKQKIATTDGQLEAQIRQAKVKIVQERVSSMEEKVKGMNETRAEVEKSLAAAQEKEARKVVKEEVAATKEGPKETVSATTDAVAPIETIAATAVAAPVLAAVVEEATADVPVAEVAAEAAPSFQETAEIVIQDTVDTAQAVAEVIGEKIDDLSDTIEDFIDSITGDDDDK